MRQLVERERVQVEVQRPRAGLARTAERHAAAVEPVLGQIDAEDVRVVLVVGMKGKAPESPGIGLSLLASRRPPRANTSTAAPVIIIARTPVRRREGRTSPQMSPHTSGCCGMSRRTSTSGTPSSPAEHPSQPRRKPQRRRAADVGEGQDADAVVGGQEELRAEPRQDPPVLDEATAAGLGAEERKPDARNVRIGPVVRVEHGGDRLWLEHRAVLVRPAAEER